MKCTAIVLHAVTNGIVSTSYESGTLNSEVRKGSRRQTQSRGSHAADLWRACVRACVCVCMYVCMYACMHVCMFITASSIIFNIPGRFCQLKLTSVLLLFRRTFWYLPNDFSFIVLVSSPDVE